ncbi:sensor histidine kinase [Alkalihalobacterium bogoriense]|uniref:sensor histidine kinase n=1 Tax=Alkalihalobacterium bogoriense TaxID=246272 RepID=UPI00047C146B|nr:sensor histidine kinase [Alkalihalobacterium bogoriense]
MKTVLMSKLKNMRLRNKLILSFTVVVFIPVLFVGVFLTEELRKIAVTQAIEQTSADMNRIMTRITETVIPAVYVSNSALVDSRLKEVVNKEYESVYEVVEAYRNYPSFENHIRYYNEISNMRFYVNNETMLNNWRFIPVTEEIRQSHWYEETLQNKGFMTWNFIEDETRGLQKSLNITRVIHFVEYGTFGVLVIDVNTNYMNWILSQEMFPTMLVDDRNQIVASNKRELVGGNLQESTISSKLMNGNTGIFQDVAFDEPSHIFVDRIEIENFHNDLRIVSIISDAEITKDARRLSRLGLLIISCSFIIAIVLIYSFSHLISKRILMLNKEMRKVAKGDLATYANVEGKDEIGELAEQFNKMTNSIQQLLKEVEQKNQEKRTLQRRQSDIKLKMLASQINPHFLFNTLETIRMKALMKEEREIAHIVKRLGKLLRSSLDVGGALIPLKQEIEMVKTYLEIQSYRFEDRLDYELLIDPEIEHIKIPPLLIQPLVENAVIHGLENKMEGGKVIVQASIVNGSVLVQVIDNGIGIADEKKEEIHHTLTEKDGETDGRIGLKNVHERIILSFKTSKGIVIQSEYEKGTRIYFYVPM